MKLLLLGPVEATVSGRTVNLGRRQERALLAVLAVQPGIFVSSDRLADLLWDGRPPDHARTGLQAMVSHLRAALRMAGASGPQLITRGNGYALDIDPDGVDLHQFRRFVADADASSVPAEQFRLLGAALRLWRGTPMSDTLDPAQLVRVLPDIDELHLGARESLLAAQVDLGGHRAAIGALTMLVTEQPLREHAVELLMIALHRSGRSGEALEAYASLADRLADELGIDPSDGLQKLHVAILRDDPVLGQDGSGRMAESRAPAQLPAAPVPFVGRAEALADLDTLRTGDAAVVVVTGSAGTGKTATALRWAHQSRDWFVDGQLFFDLRGYSRSAPATVLEALGHLLISLGVAPAEVPADVVRAGAMYRTVVADKQVLIVLDNALSAEQVRPLLPGGRGARVLVTSRESMAGLVAVQGARRIGLDPLAPEQSRQLLQQLTGHSVTADIVTELAAACDHLPLALRIVAARLQHETSLSAREHLEQLRHRRLDSLTIDGDPSAAVRAAFDLSYQRLPATARRMFRVLGLVPGMALTAAAVAALAATPDHTAEDLLSRLHDAHLTVAEGFDRYAVHDLLRLYAAQCHDAEDSDADRSDSIERIFAWYLARASAAAMLMYPGTFRQDAGVDPVAFEDREAASAWLDVERATMLQLIVHGTQIGANRPAALLADQLRLHLWSRRYQVDWLTAGRAALTAADATGEPALRAAIHVSLGQARQAGAYHQQAGAHFHRAWRLFAKARDGDGLRAVANSLGALHGSMGNLPRAAGHLEHALRIATALGSTSGAAAVLSDLGNLYAMTGRLELAHERSAAALALFREAENRPYEAVTVSNLGAICMLLGRYDEAAEHLGAALVGTREVGMAGVEAATLTNLGLLLTHWGRAESAGGCIDNALELARQLDDALAEAVARNACGYRLRMLGDVEAAVSEHKWALDAARAAHVAEIEAEALLGISLAHSASGIEGLGDAQEALVIARERGLSMLTVDALNAVAQAHHQRRELLLARESATEALTLAEEMSYGVGAGKARANLAHLGPET